MCFVKIIIKLIINSNEAFSLLQSTEGKASLLFIINIIIIFTKHIELLLVF